MNLYKVASNDEENTIYNNHLWWPLAVISIAGIACFIHFSNAEERTVPLNDDEVGYIEQVDSRLSKFRIT